MSDMGRQRAVEHWDRDGLLTTVLHALLIAGLDVDHLDVDELAATDQFHGGGLPVTIRLAELAGLARPSAAGHSRRVLDVGGGLGGPARTLAAHYGCVVTALDVTPSYVLVAADLTRRVGLADRVTHLIGDALDLPFDDDSFDIVWTQNSGMNIADKRGLYAGFHRVLRPGGTLCFQEPMAGELQPLHFPVMWAEDASMSHLVQPDEVRDILEAVGFEVREWQPVNDVGATSPAISAPHAVQQIIMGAQRAAAMAASGRANLLEGRMVSLHATLIKRLLRDPQQPSGGNRMSRDPWSKQLRIAGTDAASVEGVLVRELPVDGLQHAGGALLRAEHSDGLVAIVGVLVEALHHRGWSGDAELIAELNCYANGTLLGLIPVPVELDELGESLEESAGSESFIDLTTGMLWPAQLLDIDQPPDDFDPESDRWILVEGFGSRHAYEVMQRFIATVDSPALESRLNDAIVGTGAFRRFQAELNRHEDQYTRWHRFRDDARLGRARSWLADHGYRAS